MRAAAAQKIYPINSKPEGRKVAKVLTRALDIIETKGWCQEELEDNAGRVCATGALMCVAGKEPYRIQFQAERVLDAVVHLTHPRKTIVQFNDTRGRKVGEVKQVYRKAIKVVEAQL